MLDDATQLCFPDRGIVELPLIFEPQCLRTTAAGPAGRPLTVLLDTGTDPSAIDLRLARQWGLRVGEFALGVGAASNTIPFTETVVPWLRLGDFLIRDLFALALDLSTAPFAVDIVLGYNVLRQVVLHVDYVRRLLRLSHPDLGITTTHPAATVTFPLTFFEHFPALTDIAIGEGVHVPLATIDTGSNGGLTLGPDLAVRLGLQPGAEQVTVGYGAGFSGRSDILRGQANVVRMGPVVLHNVELDTAGMGVGDLRRAGRVNIGNRLLSRFATLTLDYGREQCVLEPATPGSDTV